MLAPLIGAAVIDQPVVASTDRALWRTPLDLFVTLNEEFRFGVDLAACAVSALCSAYYGPDHPHPDRRNGLTKCWAAAYPGGTGFLNPPWSARSGLSIDPWAVKAYAESVADFTTVALLPASISSRWWHANVMHADEVRILPRRLRYRRPDGRPGGTARFDAVVVVWRRRSSKASPLGPRIFAWDYQ